MGVEGVILFSYPTEKRCSILKRFLVKFDSGCFVNRPILKINNMRNKNERTKIHKVNKIIEIITR